MVIEVHVNMLVPDTLAFSCHIKWSSCEMCQHFLQLNWYIHGYRSLYLFFALFSGFSASLVKNWAPEGSFWNTIYRNEYRCLYCFHLLVYTLSRGLTAGTHCTQLFWKPICNHIPSIQLGLQLMSRSEGLFISRWKGNDHESIQSNSTFLPRHHLKLECKTTHCFVYHLL